MLDVWSNTHGSAAVAVALQVVLQEPMPVVKPADIGFRV